MIHQGPSELIEKPLISLRAAIVTSSRTKGMERISTAVYFRIVTKSGSQSDWAVCGGMLLCQPIYFRFFRYLIMVDCRMT